MPLTPGAKLGPYEILELIGAGGMGEVYRAHDSRLNREVAVKVSAEQFSERFEREARVIASLNHPNICTLFDVGPNYLVMELVEGPTLAQRIDEGPIPVDESVAIAKQIADALNAAHEKGIVHRDLKPGNVKIKPGGTVKVLDFGLAKAGGTPTASSDNSPTLTMGQTQAGVILGTASYMSPEQAKGKPVDKRADIYSYGVVFYEMLGGKRLHRGESITEILASVIKEEPHWEKIPPQFLPLLRRCLEKDPQQRLHDIADAKLWLEAPPAAASITPPAAPAERSNLAWALAALFLVLAAAAAPFAIQRLREKPPVAETTRFQVPAPANNEFDIYTAVAPNGRRVAFTARGSDSVVRLWIRDLDNLESRVLAGTEGANSPFWSPDSRYIAFGVGNQLKKIDSAGGPPQTLCQTPSGVSTVGSGAWNQDGVLLFGNRGGAPLLRVSSAGGVPTPVTQLESSRQETYHTLPSFLPDQHHFLYLRYTGAVEYVGVYIGSLDAKPADQPLKRLLDVPFGAHYVATPNSTLGQVLFLRDSTLMTQPFDAGRLELTGEPVPIAEQVGATNTYGNFSASPTGTLVYRTGSASVNQMTWFDRDGKAAGAAGEPGIFLNLSLSPDATRVAIQRQDRDLWLLDLARGVSTRFTFNPAIDAAPVWSPDGSKIVFRSNRNGKFDLYEKPSNGSGEETLLLATDQSKTPESWSRDGRFLLFSSQDPKTHVDLWALPLEGDKKPFPVLRTDFNEGYATFSPDGKWMAYMSEESGRVELYVRPFTPPGSAATSTGKWQISKDGIVTSLMPRWRADQKELYFRDSGGSIMAVDVTATATAFQSGVPHRLFNAGAGLPGDITADGKRFLLIAPQGPATSSPITVVLNWQAALKK